MTKLIDITGKAISGEWGNDDTDGTGIPVLRTTNFTNDGIINYESVITRSILKKNLDEKYLQEGDIIIEKSGGSTDQPVGRVVYFDAEEHKYLFNNFTGVLRVRDRDKWFPRYVFWSLYYNYRIGGTKPYQNKTTGLHNLQTDQYVRDTIIHERCISEQKRIAGLLDKTDELICLRKKQLQKLDDLIKSRFVEMFQHKGFQIVTVHDVLKIAFWLMPATPEFVIDGDVPYITSKNIKYRRIDFENVKLITKETFRILSSNRPTQVGDILISMIGTLGQTAVITDDRLFYGQNLYLLRLNGTIIDTDFFIEFFNLDETQQLLQRQSNQSTQAYLKANNIEDLLLPLPPMDLQKRYAAFVKQIGEKKNLIQKGLNQFKQMKQALMQKYFG